MKQYRVRVGDHNAYLVRYKVTQPGQFDIFLNEDIDSAGFFDEDDCILSLCQKNFQLVALEVVGTSSVLEERIPEQIEALDWV